MPYPKHAWQYNGEHWFASSLSPCYVVATIYCRWNEHGAVTFRWQINDKSQYVTGNSSTLNAAKAEVDRYCDRAEYWNNVAEGMISYMKRVCGKDYQKNPTYKKVLNKWSPFLLNEEATYGSESCERYQNQVDELHKQLDQTSKDYVLALDMLVQIAQAMKINPNEKGFDPMVTPLAIVQDLMVSNHELFLKVEDFKKKT